MHSVLLAENPPVEPCLDVGDRSHFANGGGAIALDLDFPRQSARLSAAEGHRT